MHPIQLQEGSRGIGMGYEQFVRTFTATCNEHLNEGRARAFAFVFYDMSNGIVRRALTEAHGFKALHEQSGSEMTLFYLHDKAVAAHWRSFNREFLDALGVADQAIPPCVVFFRVHGDEIEDVSIYKVDDHTDDPVLVVAEIQGYVASAIKQMNQEGDLSALTVAAKIVSSIGALIKVGEFILRLKGAV